MTFQRYFLDLPDEGKYSHTATEMDSKNDRLVSDTRRGDVLSINASCLYIVFTAP